MCNFRTLDANEIDIRVGTIIDLGNKVLSTWLLYKDARVDMNILDETVGSMNWKKTYSRDNQNCTVSIYDSEKKEWISKEDTGTESFSEKEKGLASDSFKRACVCWGIGRELYTAPKIFIELNEGDYKVNKDNKKQPKLDLKVKQIEYDKNKNITRLVIVDNKENIRFSFPKEIKKNNCEVKQEIKKEDNQGTREIFEKLFNDTVDQLISIGVDIFFDEKINQFIFDKAKINTLNIEQLNNDELNRLIQVLSNVLRIKKKSHE